MNPVIKQKWIDALRSGEYKQAKGYLTVHDGYCCLGVLCDLHAKETGHLWEFQSYYGNLAILPQIVCDWAGLSHGVPNSEKDKCNGHLATMNDAGWSFDVIAAEIETIL